MIFCTKCGGELKKGWKHCPSCGEVAAKTKSISPKNSEPTKETKINEEGI
jgi:uncharacterized membrane protein YvbJ